MRSLRSLAIRLLNLFTSSRNDRDLDDELAAHLDMHVADNVADGMTPDEARRRALLALGGVQQTKERYRERRGLPLVDHSLQDVRFGLRTLRRNPLFTAVAVFTLALGLGITTTVFTVGNWMVFGPIPGVRNAATISYFMTGTLNRRPGTDQDSVSVSRISYPNYADLTAHLKTVRLAGTQRSALTVGGGTGSPRTLGGQFVTSSYFDVLGTEMQAGRPFTSEEDSPSTAAMVAIISDRLWKSMFNREPSALQQALSINGQRVSIVGVTSAGFHGYRRADQDDIWLPGVIYNVVMRGGQAPSNRGGGTYYEFLAQLQPNYTWAQAETELTSASAWLVEQYPVENEKFKTVSFHWRRPIDTFGRTQFQTLFRLIMGACLLALLIPCSNVASLLLIRGIGRRSEVAVRKALGASRWRLVQQHVIEGVVLSLLGGAAGLLLVWSLLQVSARSTFPSLGVPDAEIPIDWRVVTFAALLSFSVGIVFSILPAIRAVRGEAIDTLKRDGSTVTRTNFLTGWILTVVQLAVSLTLVVGALLLAATLRHLSSIDLGFNAESVTAVRPGTRTLGYSEAAAWAYDQALVERLTARPGIVSVALADDVPFAQLGSNFHLTFRRLDAAKDDVVDAKGVQLLSSNYFETLGLQLIRGRSFTQEELAAPGRPGKPMVILGASLALRLFGTIEIVGKSVGRPTAAYEVIGIAADARFSELTGDPELLAYGTTRTVPNPAVIVVRGSGRINVASEIRTIGASLNPSMPLDRLVSMDEAIGLARVEWDLLGLLMIVLASLASVLAAIGVYGVIAFAVASRRREFGIRMALGATPAAIWRMVIHRAQTMVIAALVFGLAGGVGLTQVLKSRLVGVQPFDPRLWSLAALILFVTVLSASFLPALRATRATIADVLRSL